MTKRVDDKPSCLPVGPILDSKDLKEKEVIGALIGAANMVHQPDMTTRAELREYRRWLEEDYDKLDDDRKAETASWVITQLEDVLVNAVPPFCRFSGPSGEHRTWGVWPEDELIEDCIRAGELAKTETIIDFREWKKQGRVVPEFNLVVSDHGNSGNMALYRKTRVGRGYRWKGVWSVV